MHEKLTAPWGLSQQKDEISLSEGSTVDLRKPGEEEDHFSEMAEEAMDPENCFPDCKDTDTHSLIHTQTHTHTNTHTRAHTYTHTHTHTHTCRLVLYDQGNGCFWFMRPQHLPLPDSAGSTVACTRPFSSLSFF